MKNNKPQVTLIIAFYNNITALDLIFQSLAAQSIKCFEVIIADDGSKPDAVDFIHAAMESQPFTIKHVWHEDNGFRKNRILNHAVLASDSEYLIFIDGDCIPQEHFIEDHFSSRQPNSVMCGRRVDLSEVATQKFITSPSPENFFRNNQWTLMKDYIFGKGSQKEKGKNLEKGFRVTSPLLRKLIVTSKPKGIVGCNFSLFKSDLVKVNGFDMQYEAAAIGEDTDVDYRLSLIGLKNVPLFYKAVQLHLYHRILDRETINNEIFAETVKTKRVQAKLGLKELERNIHDNK